MAEQSSDYVSIADIAVTHDDDTGDVGSPVGSGGEFDVDQVITNLASASGPANNNLVDRSYFDASMSALYDTLEKVRAPAPVSDVEDGEDEEDEDPARVLGKGLDEIRQKLAEMEEAKKREEEERNFDLTFNENAAAGIAQLKKDIEANPGSGEYISRAADIAISEEAKMIVRSHPGITQEEAKEYARASVQSYIHGTVAAAMYGGSNPTLALLQMAQRYLAAEPETTQAPRRAGGEEPHRSRMRPRPVVHPPASTTVDPDQNQALWEQGGIDALLKDITTR